MGVLGKRLRSGARRRRSYCSGCDAYGHADDDHLFALGPPQREAPPVGAAPGALPRKGWIETVLPAERYL